MNGVRRKIIVHAPTAKHDDATTRRHDDTTTEESTKSIHGALLVPRFARAGGTRIRNPKQPWVLRLFGISDSCPADAGRNGRRPAARDASHLLIHVPDSANLNSNLL